MTNRRGKLHQFTAVKLPAHGTDLADQLDELTRRRDQDHRERVAAEARLNQLGLGLPSPALSELKLAAATTPTLARQYLALHRAYRALEEAHQETLFRLARTAEHKNGEAGNHMRRIGLFAGMIAEALGYPDEYCELLYKAAQMHDIGMIGIHESILRKPGALTTDEWKLMREHPRIGAGILSGSDLPMLELAVNQHWKPFR